MKTNHFSIRSLSLAAIGLFTFVCVILGLISSPSWATWQPNNSMNTVNNQTLIAQDKTLDITGIYRCNDGGTYYVRKVGDRVWWYGESGDGGTSWSNTFKGKMQGRSQIRGEWVDVPKGSARSEGNLTIRQIDFDKFIAVDQTGGFSGSEWTRRWPIRG
jgi:hypothetical protein